MATVKTLEKITRRSLPDWLTLLKNKGPQHKKEQEVWLQVKYHLSASLARLIVRHFQQQYAASGTAALNRLFSGDKRFLRPVHDKLLSQIKNWPGLSIRINSSYISLCNSRQFATLRPTKNGLVLSLKKCPRTALKEKTLLRKVDQLHGTVYYQIVLLEEADITADLLRALRLCYKAEGKS
ncbi:MAG: DUF5655 domain-containing protein [Chitinophagales bacterium]|nr:DUF5655 domain-containing protein [Chitinophagales bacterium]MDW8427479.1 DUF5655 domain-containing protein [Chitinophagales bacterium]